MGAHCDSKGPGNVDKARSEAEPLRTKNVEYVLLCAFASDLDTTGVPYMIFCSEQSQNNFTYFVAEKADEILSFVPRETLEWVNDFLEELHQSNLGDPDQADSLLRRVSNLNVGPLRTSATGSFVFDADRAVGSFEEALRALSRPDVIE